MKTSNILCSGLFFIGSTGFAVIRYVDINNLTPSPPYTSWETAAISIQDAIDAADTNDTVVVNDGVYSNGVPLYTTRNRVVLVKDITVRSVNGPEHTSIVGSGPAGSNAVRCVYIVEGTLSGFTLTNGHTRLTGDLDEIGGGGFYLLAGSISNCVVAGNAGAGYGGGGVIDLEGSVDDCIFIDNAAGLGGGGLYMRGGWPYNASTCEVSNCTFKNNVGSFFGGGVACFDGGIINDCLITGNQGRSGGGVVLRTGLMNNCTIRANAATYGGGVYALYDDTVINRCIISGNASSGGQGWRSLRG